MCQNCLTISLRSMIFIVSMHLVYIFVVSNFFVCWNLHYLVTRFSSPLPFEKCLKLHILRKFYFLKWNMRAHAIKFFWWTINLYKFCHKKSLAQKNIFLIQIFYMLGGRKRASPPLRNFLSFFHKIIRVVYIRKKNTYLLDELHIDISHR